jgi:acylphosphatase
MQAYHAIISGRVQGVFFRDSLRQEATKLGLVGWVRNLASGQVECMIAGGSESTAVIQAWLKHGPQEAEVTKVEGKWVASEAWDDFRIVPSV